VRQQLVDVDLAVLAATAVDVRRAFTSTALVVARQTAAALGRRPVEHLQIAGRVDGRAVVDARARHAGVVRVDRPVPLADVAARAVRRTFIALGVAATTSFQLHTRPHPTQRLNSHAFGARHSAPSPLALRASSLFTTFRRP